MKTNKHTGHILMIVCLLALFLPLHLKAKSISHRFDYNVEDCKVSTQTSSSGVVYDRVELADLQNYGTTAEPILPSELKIFRVPEGATDFSVKIKSLGEPKIISLANPLGELETMKSGSDMGQTSDNGYEVALYLLKQKEATAEIIDTFLLNGNEQYVRVLLSPIGYNSEAKTLSIYSSLEVELTYAETPGGQKALAKESVKTPRMFHFNDYISDTDMGLVRAVAGVNQGEDLPSTYVIIVPEDLKEAVSRLSDWKEQKGYKVVVATVEEILRDPLYAIGATPVCFDKESSVREWLKKVYKRHGAFHCLIIGDDRTSAPVRKFRSKNYGLSDPYDDDYSPTDVYFSDLVSEWTFVKDPSGLYTPPYGYPSFSPTVPVGRLLATEKEEVENFIDKVILYELYPGLGDASYLTKGFLGRHRHSLENNTQNYNLFNTLSGYDVTQINEVQGENWYDTYPFPSDVLNSLKDVGLASLQYHGDCYYLCVSGARDGWPKNHFILSHSSYQNLSKDTYMTDPNNGIENINNRFKPSIIYSLACTLAPFDYLFLKNEPLLAELNTKLKTIPGIFTTAQDFGGPVFLANTRHGYFYSSACLEQEFGKYMNKGLDVGNAENLSKIKSILPHVRVVHSIIGDPEIKIWRTEPKFINTDVVFKEKIMYIGGNLSMSDLSVGITAGGSCQRQSFANVQGALAFPLNTVSGETQEKGLASIYFSQAGIWPETFLVPISEIITDVKKQYWVNHFLMGNKGNFSNSPLLRLGSNTKIGIFSYTNISSSQGLEIQKDAALSLEALNNISLESDKVCEGGKLEVSAQRVELGKGFVIEKGGTLTIKNHEK